MIIVALNGGLGNQMFQYACGRALALFRSKNNNKEILKFDLSSYNNNTTGDTPRNFALSCFNIEVDIARVDEVKTIRFPHGIFSKVNAIFRKKILRQYNVGFNPQLEETTGNIYLEGYWQSEKYFSKYRDIILTDFSLKEKLSSQAENIKNKIAGDTYSTSIHIRRGDYITDEATNKMHGTCDLQYYQHAIEYLTQKLGNLNFYIFSDDIDWVCNSRSWPKNTVFVSNESLQPFEEMILMSECKNNIIANSSFSWWGAWLNRHSDKIVVAPKRWSRKHNEDWYKDIIPHSWIRM